MADREAFELNGGKSWQSSSIQNSLDDKQATRSKATRQVNQKAEDKKSKKKTTHQLIGLREHEIYEDIDIFRKVLILQSIIINVYSYFLLEGLT